MHINPSLDALIMKQLQKLLGAIVIIPIRYSMWVANLFSIWKKIDDNGFAWI